MPPEVIGRSDAGMVAQPSRGPGFALDAGPGLTVQALGLDPGEGQVAAKAGVVGQIGTPLAAFTQQLLDLVAAIGKGSWFGRG